MPNGLPCPFESPPPMRSAILALTTALLATPIHAQDTVDRAFCGTGFDTAIDLLDLGEGLTHGRVLTTSDGWCEVENIVYLQRYVGIRIDRIRWRGAGFDNAVLPGFPLQELVLHVEGARNGANIPSDPVMTYLMGLQQLRSKTDIMLDASWDREAETLVLNRLHVNFPGENSILAAGRVVGFNAENLVANPATAMGFGLTEMMVSVESNGLFESLGMAIGVGVLAGSENPEKRVEELKAEADAFIKALPQNVFPDPTRSELSEALADLPTPSGTLTVEFSAPEAVGPAQMMAVAINNPVLTGDFQTLWQVLDKTEITATYQPTAE